MLGPSRGLTYEETTHFIAELEQRCREVEGEEKERLAWALSVWLEMVAVSDLAPVPDLPAPSPDTNDGALQDAH